MTQPVNLNKMRKARMRAQKKAQANANAALHGLSRAEKQRLKTDKDKARATLDAHKREP